MTESRRFSEWLRMVLLAALLAALWLHEGLRKSWPAKLGWTVLLLLPFAWLAGMWISRAAQIGSSPGGDYFAHFVERRGILSAAVSVVCNIPLAVDSFADTIFGTGLTPLLRIALAVITGTGLVIGIRRHEWLLTVYGILYLLATCLASPGRRYLLPLLPVLLYWLLLGIHAVGMWLVEQRHAITKERALQCARYLLIFALAANLIRVSKVVQQARSSDFYARTNDEHALDYFELTAWLREHAHKNDRVLAHERGVVHYFSRASIAPLSIITRSPDMETVARHFQRDGISYMVRDPHHPKTTERMDQMIQSYPEAFSPARTSGKLILYHVDLDALNLDEKPQAIGGRMQPRH